MRNKTQRTILYYCNHSWQTPEELYDTTKERWICKFKLCTWCELHNYALWVSQSYRPSAKSYITHLAANRYQKKPIKICHQLFFFLFKEWPQGTLEMSWSPLAALAKTPCSLDHCFYNKKHLEWISSAMLNRQTPDFTS